jgi:hypothetical protein
VRARVCVCTSVRVCASVCVCASALLRNRRKPIRSGGTAELARGIGRDSRRPLRAGAAARNQVRPYPCEYSEYPNE